MKKILSTVLLLSLISLALFSCDNVGELTASNEQSSSEVSSSEVSSEPEEIPLKPIEYNLSSEILFKNLSFKIDEEHSKYNEQDDTGNLILNDTGDSYISFRDSALESQLNLESANIFFNAYNESLSENYSKSESDKINDIEEEIVNDYKVFMETSNWIQKSSAKEYKVMSCLIGNEQNTYHIVFMVSKTNLDESLEKYFDLILNTILIIEQEIPPEEPLIVEETSSAQSSSENTSTTPASSQVAVPPAPIVEQPVTQEATEPQQSLVEEPPAPVQAPDTQPQSQGVFYTRTGSKYHYRNPCGNGTYYPCTLDEALAKGLTACDKCVN